MSRTHRKDRMTTYYSLEAYVDRALDRHRRLQCYRYAWLRKYHTVSEAEVIESAKVEWLKYKRDGKGWVRMMREQAIEGKVCGWRDGSKSMKALPNRAARRQQKEALQKFVKEYDNDDDNDVLDFII